MRDFTKYNVWKDSVEFCTAVYKLTSSFPDSAKFGLVSQLRRAAVSISSNIAEGASRTSEMEFCRFIEIAIGSGFEIKSQTIVSAKLGFISNEQEILLINDLDSVLKQLSALRNKLKK